MRRRGSIALLGVIVMLALAPGAAAGAATDRLRAAVK